jgi:hypothetical protein
VRYWCANATAESPVLKRLRTGGPCRASAKGRQVPSGIAKSPLAARVAPIPTRSERSSGFEELLARHCAWAYFPREVFFFGFGFGFVPLLVPAVCRFCFLVAIFPPGLRARCNRTRC